MERILAIDVGDSRLGLATANTVAKIPSPFRIINNDDKVFDVIISTVKDEQIDLIVIGLPRNMKGEETHQSVVSRQFADQLKDKTELKIVFIDEGLSTKRAETDNVYIGQRTDPKHLDDVAACFILEEYLEEIG